MILKRPLSENCIFLNCHFYVSEINFLNMTFSITKEYFNTVFITSKRSKYASPAATVCTKNSNCSPILSMRETQMSSFGLSF